MQKTTSGFTLIEVIIVMIIMGVLALLAFVGYGNFNSSVITAQMKSDLNGVAAAMENSRMFNNSYPSSVPSNFTSSQGVTLTGGSYDSGMAYCVDAVSSQYPDIHFYIDSLTAAQGAKSGTCALAHPTPITAIAAITGTTTVGNVLTAGALTPSGATVTYQWQSAATAGGTYTNIAGATAGTYTLVSGDWTKYIKVVATATGAYSGTQTSAASSVVLTPITNIAAITGATTSVGSILTAGALTPSGATVTYQWQSAATVGGTYVNIAGATASTYTIVVGNVGKYTKVVATATGNYTGTQTSAASAVISDPNWLAIGSQVWAKANLNVGTMVAGTTNQTNNAILEKYCYNNTESNCTTYGGLYQWNEAMQYVTTQGAQGICPAGSHIPSDNDIKILEMQLGMTQAQADATGWRGTDQGAQIKLGGTSGLNLPLAGVSDPDPVDGGFAGLLGSANYWTSSVSDIYAWTRNFSTTLATVNREYNVKYLGMSVRCVGN